jgi:hypothetical protein
VDECQATHSRVFLLARLDAGCCPNPATGVGDAQDAHNRDLGDNSLRRFNYVTDRQPLFDGRTPTTDSLCTPRPEVLEGGLSLVITSSYSMPN